MKRSTLAIIPALSLAALLASCGGKKDQPVVVKSYETYTDNILKFSVRYPSDWSKGIQPGSQAVFYTTQAVADAFRTYEPAGPGAKIDLFAMKGGEEEMNKSISDLKGTFGDPQVMKGSEKVTLNGMQATKISYGFDVRDTKFTAERYYVVQDGVVSYFETAAFGTYANYAAVFDSARASFQPGKLAMAAPVDTTGGATAVRDSDVVEVPAPELKPFANPHFTISYPGNFSPNTLGGKKLADVAFRGARNDSYFQVGVDKAPDGVTLEQLADGNKKRFGAGSKTSLGGVPAYAFNYSGAPNVASRVYVLVSGGKIYQITVNWFKPQQANYQPAFEKALATFKAK